MSVWGWEKVFFFSSRASRGAKVRAQVWRRRRKIRGKNWRWLWDQEPPPGFGGSYTEGNYHLRDDCAQVCFHVGSSGCWMKGERERERTRDNGGGGEWMDVFQSMRVGLWSVWYHFGPGKNSTRGNKSWWWRFFFPCSFPRRWAIWASFGSCFGNWGVNMLWISD